MSPSKRRLYGLDTYRSVLAVGAVLILYSQLDQYLYGAFGAVPPLYWLALGGVLASPIVARHIARLEIPQPQLVAAAAMYALVLVWGWVRSTKGIMAQQALETGALSVLVMLLLANLFATREAVSAARYAMAAVVIASVAISLYEYLSPAYNLNAVSPWAAKDKCRAGGLYVNPNGSAIALILGMILAAPVVSQKWRPMFALWTGLGVVLSFSRAGYLLYPVAIFGLAWQRLIPLKRFAWQGAVFAASIAVLLVISAHLSWKVSYCLGIVQSPNTSHLLDGISSSINSDPSVSGSGVSSSISERIVLLRAAMDLASQSDYLGAGLGALAEATAPLVGRAMGAHNMYLQLMAEAGIPGLLLMPWVLWMLARAQTGGEPKISFIFASVYGLWALFDHNMLDTFAKLLALALMFASVSSGRDKFVSTMPTLFSRFQTRGRLRFRDQTMVSIVPDYIDGGDAAENGQRSSSLIH